MDIKDEAFDCVSAIDNAADAHRELDIYRSEAEQAIEGLSERYGSQYNGLRVIANKYRGRLNSLEACNRCMAEISELMGLDE